MMMMTMVMMMMVRQGSGRMTAHWHAYSTRTPFSSSPFRHSLSSPASDFSICVLLVASDGTYHHGRAAPTCAG
jgi:hypothetical protein